MNLIDIHTHYFPDSIAKNTIKTLHKFRGEGLPVYGDGISSSLEKYMETDGVLVSVNQPVATKKEQVISVNRKMIEMNKTGKKIINFGCFHPEFDKIGNTDEEIEYIAKNGIKGIKIHPEYQSFYPDDDKMRPLYEACRKNNIIILFHAGVDLGFNIVHADPKRLAQVAKITGLKIILAHFGSYKLWDDVLKYLAGTDAYFDTSYIAEMNDNILRDILKKHGKEKILFGSDFPWERAVNIKNKLDNILEPDEKENIYYKNSEKLLYI